jgi:hypothetical protein
MQGTELVFIFSINQFMFCTIPEMSPFWQNCSGGHDNGVTQGLHKKTAYWALCKLNKSALYMGIWQVCSPLSEIKIYFVR